MTSPVNSCVGTLCSKSVLKWIRTVVLVCDVTYSNGSVARATVKGIEYILNDARVVSRLSLWVFCARCIMRRGQL